MLEPKREFSNMLVQFDCTLREFEGSGAVVAGVLLFISPSLKVLFVFDFLDTRDGDSSTIELMVSVL